MCPKVPCRRHERAITIAWFAHVCNSRAVSTLCDYCLDLSCPIWRARQAQWKPREECKCTWGAWRWYFLYLGRSGAGSGAPWRRGTLVRRLRRRPMGGVLGAWAVGRWHVRGSGLLCCPLRGQGRTKEESRERLAAVAPWPLFFVFVRSASKKHASLYVVAASSLATQSAGPSFRAPYSLLWARLSRRGTTNGSWCY